MKNVKSGLIAVALLTSISGGANAGGQFYGAIDFGQSRLNGFCDAMAGTATCKETDSAFRGSLGYQVMPNFALEAGYGNYGTAVATGGGLTVEGEVTSLQVSAIGSYPIDKNFSVTGKLGMALSTLKANASFGGNSASADDDDTDLVFGAGVRYNINEAVGIRGQFERINNDDAIDFLSVGVIFNF